MSSTSSSEPNEPLRILLVEDDLDQAHLVRFLVEDTGNFQVTVAQDGVRGSELARKGGWALLITDLNLPGAYGIAVVEASRSAHPDTPILATTGFTGPEYGAEALNKGADAVLLKPLQRDELLEQIASLVKPRPQADTGANGSEVTLRVLAVGLHPGEVEAGCGATLLRHIARGDEVALLVLGDGGTVMGGRARSSGRRMGVRFFVGSEPPGGPDTFGGEAEKLLRAAFGELSPDVVYLPSPHRRNPLGPTVMSTTLELAGDVPRIFCYDPGDPTPDFHPSVFVPIDSVLAEKVRLLRGFDPPADSPIHPAQAVSGARFWGRMIQVSSAEALEAVRGEAPWLGATDPEPAPATDAAGAPDA